MAERLDHRALDVGMFQLELGDEPLDPLALEAQVAARRTAAADHRQPALLRIAPGLGLGDVDERPDDDVLAVVRDESRRHRLERALEKEIEERGLDEIVEVMAERDLRRADG